MSYGFNPSGALPRAMKILLIANVAIFLADLLTGGRFIHVWMALDPDRTLHDFQLWRLVTYLFVHDLTPPYMHLLINMLILWMFGTPLVDVMGERKFWWFYITTGVFSGICSLVFFAVTHNPAVIVGASGAIFGLMFAYAHFFPTQQILILLLFPMQARYAVLVFGAIELLSILSVGNIAHVTHVAGALYGWMYFRFEDRAVQFYARWKNRHAVRRELEVKKTAEEAGQVMVDIDPILKKISQSGMGSLTRDEKEMLKKASEIKRKAKSKLISLDDYRKRK